VRTRPAGFAETESIIKLNFVHTKFNVVLTGSVPWVTRRGAVACLLAMMAAVAGAQPPAVAPRALTGRVESGGRPVSGATVELESPRRVARSDSGGVFRLSMEGVSGTVTIRARAIGHAPLQRRVTVTAASADTVVFGLTPSAATLNTVVTTGTMQERYLSDSPVKVELVTPAALQRNVSATLMDNVSFLPGLTQQVDCGVCFTNNIRINGMEGPYTAVLIDGTPMMSALATVYGLNSIDPSLIEQIEIIRGPNSTLYGSEAMGGVINIVTKDARLAPRLSLNAFGTSDGETSVSLAASPRIGSARSLLSVTGAYNARFVDRNGDGFSDLPLVSRLSVMNKWALGTAAARPFEIMGRVYAEDRFGGTSAWTRADRGSASVYGESIRTLRGELLAAWRTGSAASPVRVDFAANWHHQDSYYGDTPYLASQRVLFAQGIWSPQRVRHAPTFGATLRQQVYRDQTRAQTTADTRLIPGVFAQDELLLTPQFTVLAGLRADHHQAHGVIPAPRLALKWTPDHHTTVRLNTASGFRVVSLFTEDHAALTGARDVRIAEALKPERSATLTLNVNRVLDVHGIEDALTLDLDLFHTRFSNRIVADFDQDPDLIVYQNLRGRAVTQGASISAAYATLRQPSTGGVAITLQDVFAVNDGARRSLPYAPTVQGVFNLGYRFGNPGVTVDWTGRVQGPAPLPQFEGLPARSPWFTEQHLQVTLRRRGAPDFYVGVKNLFNFIQRDAIIDPFQPFGDRFDTARVYGPLQGRRVMVGMRQVVGR
jgi:outer membrane receptor for ferrienterochelin and colicins